MTPKQKDFAQQWIIDKNSTKAAERAGYSKNTAAQQGARLYKNVNIRKYIDKLLKKQSIRTGNKADKVLNEIAKLAYGNVQDFYDGKGNLKPIQDLKREQAACITEIKTVEKFDKDGKLTTYTTYKISDKGVNLERLGRNLKLFTDKIDLNLSLEDKTDDELDNEINSINKELSESNG
jgi:phage terminase small subunit